LNLLNQFLTIFRALWHPLFTVIFFDNMFLIFFCIFFFWREKTCELGNNPKMGYDNTHSQVEGGGSTWSLNLMLLRIFGDPHKQKIKKKRKRENIKNWKKYWKKIKKMHTSWEKIPECPRNLQKTIRGRLKLDLTAYLWLVRSPNEQRKFILTRKIQAWMFKDSIEIF